MPGIDRAFRLVQKDEADGVDGKVGKHVHKPRYIDTVLLFVEPIEDYTAHSKSCNYQQIQPPVKPADHHGNMIKGKREGAEAVGKPPGAVFFQIVKQKTAEKEFLQQGIGKGDVQAHKQEIILCHAGVLGQIAGNSGKVDKAAQQEVSAQYQPVEPDTKKQGDGKAFSAKPKNTLEQKFFVKSGQQKRDQQK